MKTLSIAREYQQRDINKIQDIIGRDPEGSLVYQLPTCGGKTFMFCELARHYIRQYHRRVVILTHRRELCRQTVKMLELADIPTQVIEADSEVSLQTNAYCTVAMVETLNNRLSLEEPLLEGGLLIIDEAHNNSFQKLFQHFPNWFRLGFTATPLSSDAAFPLNKTYSELLIGETVNALIEQKFLAKPRLFSYDVDIAALERGTGGDFTTSSSDTLYGLDSMLALLLESYTKHSKGKKTLIFNNGIITSKKVAAYFSAAGITIRHLDNTASDSERSETLKWFRNTKDAILTSVSLFTTGFDEPGIQTVILNRATTSITLYYQMIGRGARYMDRKRTFTIIDLGNNTDRFGDWMAPLDWNYIFEHPEEYYEKINS
ncbi:MAG: DEAD/DEAH box helicase, partial [Chitinophagaceae bacterium]